MTEKASLPLIPGVPVCVAGRDLIVPSLTARQFRDHYEVIGAPMKEGENVAEFIAARIPIFGLALRRNYPELTDEDLLDMVDLGNFKQLSQAVQAASGMKQVKPGEAQPAPGSTGAGSTAQ